MKFAWWRPDPIDEARIEDARRQLEDAQALASRLRQHRRENHFGEKMHAALRPREGR